MSFDYQNGRLKIGGFDTAHGMMLSFGTFDGTLIYPSRTTGGSSGVWGVETTVAVALDPRAAFAIGMARFEANGFWTSAWFGVGGTTIVGWWRDPGNGFYNNYIVWPEISGGTFLLKGRQEISDNSTVQIGTLHYRLALLGFASATT